MHNNQISKIDKTRSICYMESNKLKETCFGVLLDNQSDFKDKDIELYATQENTYDALIFSILHNTKLFINNQQILLTKLKNQIQEFNLLLDYAVTKEQKRSAIESLAYLLSLRVPHEYQTALEAVDIFCPDSPRQRKAHLQTLVQNELNKRALFIKQSSTITSPETVLTLPYGAELIQFILKHPGVYVLNGPMGSGKTQKVKRPLFYKLSEEGQYPFLCTSKCALANELISIDDVRHYQSELRESVAADDENEALWGLGVCGVLNTLMRDKFKPLRAKSQWLLLEELEDLLNHVTGDAIEDGSLQAKEKVLATLLKQVSQSHHIVITDAFLSDQSLDLIKKHTDLPVYICPGVKSNTVTYPSVNIYPSEAQIIASIENDLNDGNRVLLFTDCSRQADNPKFQQLFSLLNQYSCHSLILDADCAKKLNLSEVFEENYQLVQISPVITSGVSIEQDLFDKVYVLGKQTIHPNQLLQILFRYRRAKSIELHLAHYYCVTSDVMPPLYMLFHELSQQLRKNITDEEFARLRNSPVVNAILERKCHEQKLRVNYVNNFMGLLDLHGFRLSRIATDEEQKQRGEAHLKQISKSKNAVWPQKTHNDYQQLLLCKDPTQLTLIEFFIHSFLVKFVNILHIKQPGLDSVCSGTDFGELLNWIHTGAIESGTKNLSIPVNLLLKKLGLNLSSKFTQKKPPVDKLLRFFLSMKSEVYDRDSKTETNRTWIYKLTAL